MGIDIAWNAAISLRPLDEGQEDKHRMISNYADWDINAKLPHGIESVKRHLKEVDNVPLLVSLYTDVTKVTTRQMVRNTEIRGFHKMSYVPNAGTRLKYFRNIMILSSLLGCLIFLGTLISFRLRTLEWAWMCCQSH